MTAPAHTACDRAIAHSAAAGDAAGTPAPPAQGAWILATCILASSLAFIDGSVVNVGLPAIGHGLQGSGSALAWVLNGYLLPLSALLLLGGALGDRQGRRRWLVVGSAVFGAASLACALAPSVPALVAGRLLQGVGAAMVLPNSLGLLGAAFSGAARGRAVGLWAAVGAAAGAAGPLAGGWLIDAVGWRAIFYINLPIAAAAIVLAWRHVPPDATGPRTPLDVAGGALATLALGGLTWSLTAWSAAHGADAGGGAPDEGAIAAWSATTVAAVTGAVGVAAMVAFVVVERRRGDRAMLPPGLFASRQVVGLTLLTLLLYGALTAVMVLVPFVLIGSRGASAVSAGAALLPLPLVIAAGSPLMGRLAARTGPRLPLVVGPLVVAAGCALALRTVTDGPYWTAVFPGLLVIALGMAVAVAPLTNAVLGSVQPDQAGVASGVNSAVARLGGLVASALLGGVLAAHGPALAAAFRVAVLASGGAAALAGVCAWLWVRGTQERPKAATPP